MKRIYLLTFLLAFLLNLVFCVALQAQDVTGKWKTIDDETGKAKSIVEIYKQNGKLYGQIRKLLNREPGDENPICTKCPDDRKGKRIVGMQIIRDLENDGETWKDGEIIDPKTGKIYDCKLWLDEADKNKLNVRGYILFFFRTQNWFRVSE